MILISSGSLSNILKIFYAHLYTKYQSPDSSFCLNDFRFGGKFDLVLFTSCSILGLCLLECNLDFIEVLGFYYVETLKYLLIVSVCSVKFL